MTKNMMVEKHGGHDGPHRIHCSLSSLFNHSMRYWELTRPEGTGEGVSDQPKPFLLILASYFY